jgi:hypothetical protein
VPLTSVGARVLAAAAAEYTGTLRLADGRQVPFSLAGASGFLPSPGLAVVALLDESGAVVRVHLPAHPSKADSSPSVDVTWVTVLRERPLPADAEGFRTLLEGIGAPRPRIVHHPRDASLHRPVDLIWPLMHMMLIEREGAFSLDHADCRALPARFNAGTHAVSFLPSAVDPSQERRLAGSVFPDPWEAEGTLRRASRILRALLMDGRGMILHRAGQLVLTREDALRRLGDLNDAAARPFGAWIDWALTEDRRAYRTFGMSTLGGEDVEIALTNPDAEVELDSAESALLFACMLQVRENRFLDDGELFHVPKDVRVGARGASATSQTGYRYFAHRGHARVQLVRG